jgi:hypothetical protein
MVIGQSGLGEGRMAVLHQSKQIHFIDASGSLFEFLGIW